MTSEIDWTESLNQLASAQTHAEEVLTQVLSDVAEALAGKSPASNECRTLFYTFAVMTLWYQQQMAGIRKTQLSSLPEAEGFLDFENVKRQFIRGI